MILFRANQIREQYHLIQKIPNWEIFVEVVVTRCFEVRRKDGKITNMIFNEWVNEYKNKTLNTEAKAAIKQKNEFESPHKSELVSELEMSRSKKKFTPIILTKNY